MNIKDYLNEKGYFKEDVTLKTALLDDNNIYIDSVDMFFQKNTYPINSIVFKLPTKKMISSLKDNEVIQYVNDTYIVTENHIGQDCYKKENGELVVITELGPVPNTLTNKPYLGELYVWVEDENAWLIDNEKQLKQLRFEAEAQKSYLMAQAKEQIEILTDAVDFGEATADDEVLLKQWKLYRIQLNKIDPQNAPDVVWPNLPVGDQDAN